MGLLQIPIVWKSMDGPILNLCRSLISCGGTRAFLWHARSDAVLWKYWPLEGENDVSNGVHMATKYGIIGTVALQTMCIRPYYSNSNPFSGYTV